MKCSTPYCRNPKAMRRNGRSYGAKCHACRMARWRENQPIRAAYCTLRTHAKERGIEFTISFSHFATFAARVNYIELTGLHRMALTVDRRDNRKGYVPGNIQVLTRSANSVKRCKQDMHRMRAGYAWQQAA